MITEEQYLEAQKLVKAYQEQLKQALVIGSGNDEDIDEDWELAHEPCPTCGDVMEMRNACCANYDPLHIDNCGYG